MRRVKTGNWRTVGLRTTSAKSFADLMLKVSRKFAGARRYIMFYVLIYLMSPLIILCLINSFSSLHSEEVHFEYIPQGMGGIEQVTVSKQTVAWRENSCICFGIFCRLFKYLPILLQAGTEIHETW
jgi:hypothetical protein